MNNWKSNQTPQESEHACSAPASKCLSQSSILIVSKHQQVNDDESQSNIVWWYWNGIDGMRNWMNAIKTEALNANDINENG